MIGWIQENDTRTSPVVSGCEATNVTITVTPNADGSSYDNGDKAGGLIGYAAKEVKIQNCKVTNATITGYRDLGGIVGCSLPAADSDGETYKPEISGCTATEITIIQDLEKAYKDEYPTTLGAVYGRGEATGISEGTIKTMTIKNCSPTYAQGALDAINSPRTIELVAGEYGVLYLRWNDAAEKVEDDGNWAGGGRTYLRTIWGLTIQGVTDTKMTSINAESCTYAGTEHSLSATHTYLQTLMKVDNLTIKNIDFTPAEGKTAVQLANSGQHISIDGLTIENCTVTGTNSSITSGNRLFNSDAQSAETFCGLTMERKNITISNCTMNNLHQGIKINYVEGLTISDNKFNTVYGQNMLFNCTGTGLTGNIAITDNTSDSSTERFIRMVALQGNLTVSNNTVTNYTGTDKEIVKITGSGTGASVTFTNNIWNTADDAAAKTNGTVTCDLWETTE